MRIHPISRQGRRVLAGLWHGFTILFSLIGSLIFDVRIYAFPNAGCWYDVGFLLGASVFFDGGAASAGAM